ncbi:MAG: hypothetical protein IJ499_05280 [Clostridia bacterium]|nr:hypothetical protein [Clostridia bacterium]
MEEEKKIQEFVCDEDPVIQDSAAARRLKALGEDTVNEHESKYGGRKIGKAENFWYQHRWHAGIFIVLILGVIIAVYQIATHVSPDVLIAYAGPADIVATRYEAFEEAILSVATDYDGDGNIKISMSDNTYLNADQIAERNKLTGNSAFDHNKNTQAYNRYMTIISGCEHLICFLDPALHNEVASLDGFVPLSEIFEETPSSAYGEYGIRLGDTAFYDHFKEISYLPADTVIAVRTITLDPSEKKQKSQEYHIELLRKITEFDPADTEAE